MTSQHKKEVLFSFPMLLKQKRKKKQKKRDSYKIFWVAHFQFGVKRYHGIQNWPKMCKRFLLKDRDLYCYGINI